ncbi:hypothetical protein RND71_043496 [Anisodus tanguticus]|uniref:Nop domain-containing protein n=1 Tax=Anisodus tanguticus TaxID=243964 RepID=A0AAE1QPE8_9SOLA|nr:hypothetical protein RND71_043496 [Anisodus tanguticus]
MLANLCDSPELKRIIEEIDKRSTNEVIRKSSIHGPIEAHPEYKLIVDANNITVQIDDDINMIHKFIRERYSKLLPELDSFVPGIMDYILTVRHLGNNLMQVKDNPKIQEILPQATIMVVNMTGSTKKGNELSDEELKEIFDACDMAIELDNNKMKIFEFVESRMSFIAPNLSQIVGANIAAKLMGLAGGLTNLSKMPACNIEVLGSKKKHLYGFSSKNALNNTGILYYSELVQSQPPDLRRKAAKLVSNKSTICARVDSMHAAHDGEIGKDFREKIEKALDKLKEPPPVKQNKALPAPIDQQKKKRGGKRVRKLKERMAMTEFRKQTNRMNFGEIEEDAYQDDLSFTTGTIGKSGSGRIRKPQVDNKTKVRISRGLQKDLQKYQVYGGTSTIKKPVSGTASSVSFTPLQGLEIQNPLAAESKMNEANAKYFSNTSGFVSVIKKF